MAEKDVRKDEREDECDKFWDPIERETGARIPSYIRNLLKYNGFDSPLSMQLLDESDINDIERLVQSGTMKSLLPKNFDFTTIYGPFHESVDKFTFLRGHRKSLLAITAHIKEKGPQNINKTNIFTNTAGKSKNDSASRQMSRSQFNGSDVSLVARSTDSLDMNKERGFILQKITTWVQSFNPAAYEKYKQKINCEMLVVKVVEPNSVDPVMKLSADVKCPACNKTSNAPMISKKLVGEGRGKPQWCISNFQAHFRTHYKGIQNGGHTHSGLFSLLSNNEHVKASGVSKNTSDNNFQTITIADDVIRSENDENEIDEVIISSRKRKFNRITDDESDKDDIPTKSSGESMPGVLTRQNTPTGDQMP